ncbi:hypothetical protein HPB50_009745 [Hyalomma asiaticum]|uniref:Uncharacterized protein n=1 Tax=Hyalomma asiaticum TaxID=266040 RepID=A0ACB7TG16_HYAAI|nr:hypothetical protein HPB50_009745 [Hyalomma asiaticum]
MPAIAAPFSWSAKAIGHCPSREEDRDQRPVVLSKDQVPTPEKESAAERGSFATVWTKETFGRWIFGIKVRIKTDDDSLTFLTRSAPLSASPTWGRSQSQGKHANSSADRRSLRRWSRMALFHEALFIIVADPTTSSLESSRSTDANHHQTRLLRPTGRLALQRSSPSPRLTSTLFTPYGLPDGSPPLHPLYARARPPEVRKRIREEESAQWQMSLQQKSTLQLYRTYKETIAPESLYDNSGGSGLLFEARAGALRTLTYRSHFDPSIDSTLCRACGAEKETVEHLVLQCQKLSLRPPEATTLPQALALTDRNAKVVATTKARLQQ